MLFFSLDSLEMIEEKWRPANRIQFQNIFHISAKTNLNVDSLCNVMRDLIDELDDVKRNVQKRETARRIKSNSDDDGVDFGPV